MSSSSWLVLVSMFLSALLSGCGRDAQVANDVAGGSDARMEVAEKKAEVVVHDRIADVDLVGDVAPEHVSDGADSTDIFPVDLTGLESVAELDELSLFTFIIFSDNKGDGPDDSLSMESVVDAAVEMDSRFALGLGDHVKGGSRDNQSFVPFVTSDPWWSVSFYPNIADGENAYYGVGQGDWGAGAGLVDALGLCDLPGVTCRENHAEYHAVMQIDDIAVHYISVHYPDSGDDPFPEASKDYLVAEVEGIARTGGEIVIAAAHTGMWVELLDDDDREVVLAGTDLLLGATSHFYERYDYPDDKALFLNTGSAGYSLFNNYLQVNVVDNPLRIIVQNMEAEGLRLLQAGGNCWVKEIQGTVKSCDFENGHSWGLFGQ